MIIRYYHFDKINLKYFSDKLMLNQLCVRSMQVVSGRRRMGGRFLSQTTIGRRCLSCNPSHHLICSSSTALILLLPLTQESGRLQYFGFSSMDCGIVIRDIGTRDSGGWTCRVSATVAGKHQVSADIVRLFVGETFSHINIQTTSLQARNSALLRLIARNWRPSIISLSPVIINCASWQ